jgi:F-type H+-transporting ATPase subunit delta
MNKITTKEIAKVIYEVTEGKKEEEIKAIMPKIADLVVRFGLQDRLSEIDTELERIKIEQEGLLEVQIESVDKVDNKEIEGIVDTIAKGRGIDKDKVVTKEKINKDLKGGLKIKIGDEVFDGSVAGKLEKMRKLF